MVRYYIYVGRESQPVRRLGADKSQMRIHIETPEHQVIGQHMNLH